MSTFSDELKSITKKGCLNVTDTYSSVSRWSSFIDLSQFLITNYQYCFCENSYNLKKIKPQDKSFLYLTNCQSYINISDITQIFAKAFPSQNVKMGDRIIMNF